MSRLDITPEPQVHIFTCPLDISIEVLIRHSKPAKTDPASFPTPPASDPPRLPFSELTEPPALQLPRQKASPSPFTPLSRDSTPHRSIGNVCWLRPQILVFIIGPRFSAPQLLRVLFLGYHNSLRSDSALSPCIQRLYTPPSSQRDPLNPQARSCLPFAASPPWLPISFKVKARVLTKPP